MTSEGIPLDAFAIEELRRRYLSADANGRIALLQDDNLPFEIARLVVNDPNVEVRQWFARNGRDYRELSDDDTRDLLEILRKDPDPFIRACVYTNPSFSMAARIVRMNNTFQGRALAAMVVLIEEEKSWWTEATHLERLAMTRRRSVGSQILKVFDLNDEELGLSLEERRELILAFLAGQSGQNARRDSESSEIWELVSEWPHESDVPPLVYRFLPTSDKGAAEIYGVVKNPEWRRAILCMVWGQDETEKWTNAGHLYRSTLALATKDSDNACRLLAHASLCLGDGRHWQRLGYNRRDRFKQWQKLQRAAKNDIYALSGLAKNSSLSPRELQWVMRRAYALAGSLEIEDNLWVNLGGDKGYTVSEKDLPNIIRQDVERTISKLRFERELQDLRVSDDNRFTNESTTAWTQDEKFDYLASLSLNTSAWAIFAQCCGIASGLGLIVFAIAYIVGDSLALALFLFFLCLWLGWLFAYWAVRWFRPAFPPWASAKTYKDQYKRLWGEGLRKPPVIEERAKPQV
ncbi:MAG TPA: cell division protein FtsA [Candidatus Binataceae bacterium]|nr:cell division protein FtsA [Candidatus Binataceae bacterium]